MGTWDPTLHALAAETALAVIFSTVHRTSKLLTAVKGIAAGAMSLGNDSRVELYLLIFFLKITERRLAV